MKKCSAFLIIKDIQIKTMISPHTCQNGYNQKDFKKTSVGKDVEKKGNPHALLADINWYIHCGKYYRVSSKIVSRITI